MLVKPAERVDTTIKIFDYLYRVRINYMLSRSVEDLKQNGTTISGIASYDADIGNQMINMQLSIAQMVDYFAQGVPIYVCDTKDTKEIYESISAHIYAWKARLERGINIGDAPIEDLINMDKFANTVYTHAKYIICNDTGNSVFAQYMAKVQRLNQSNFFTKRTLVNQPSTSSESISDRFSEPKKQEEDDSRDSLAEFFKSRTQHLRRY